MAPVDCLIGIVGYSPVLEGYPLGPHLLEELERRLDDRPHVKIENLTWGPVHIVQHFQDETGPRPARLILIGAAPRSCDPGRVTAFRWIGGKLSDAALQERMYEAVTGIVDIDNTLAIGEHFGIWPQETYVVEIDLPVNCFGEMVMAGTAQRTSDAELSQVLGFSPEAATNELISRVAQLASCGPPRGVPLPTKSAVPLPAGATFAQTHIRRHEGSSP